MLKSLFWIIKFFLPKKDFYIRVCYLLPFGLINILIKFIAQGLSQWWDLYPNQLILQSYLAY